MKPHVLLIFLVLIVASPLQAEPPTVHCPEEPPTVRRLELKERWRIDAEDPDATK